MGLKGFLRSLEADRRAREREERRRANALSRGHRAVDRVVDRLDAEVERDVEKVVLLEQKFREKPISATGIQYDRSANRWSFKPVQENTGSIKWSFNIQASSDPVVCSGSVSDGPRTYGLRAICATRWGVYAAFEISSSGTPESKATKLFTKTDPSRNRVFLGIATSRYQAIEGTLDAQVFGPEPVVALVAFPLPKIRTNTARIEFQFKGGAANIDLRFSDADVFCQPAENQSLAEAVRDQLEQKVDELREQGERTKAHIAQTLKPQTGCLFVWLVAGGLMATTLLAAFAA